MRSAKAAVVSDVCVEQLNLPIALQVPEIGDIADATDGHHLPRLEPLPIVPNARAQHHASVLHHAPATVAGSTVGGGAKSKISLSNM